MPPTPGPRPTVSPWAVLAWVLALLLPLPAGADANRPLADTRREAPGLSGRWLVSYHDAELGEVQGVAAIDETRGEAEVRLIHPTTEQSHYLTATSFERRGNTVTLVLEGRSPSGPATTIPDLGSIPGLQVIRVPEGSTRVSAEYDHRRGEATIVQRGDSDRDRVTLRLEYDGRGELTGSWSYYADRTTRRERGGRGRVHTFELAEGAPPQGVQHGPERCERLAPIIAGVVVLEDHTHRLHPEVPGCRYPFGDGGGVASTRTLFVYGVNLPTHRSEGAVFGSDSPEVRYRRAYLPSDTLNNAWAREVYERGRERALATLPPEHRDALGKLDTLIIEASFGEGAVPGTRRFSINGAEAPWNLNFGDNWARLHFARAVGPDEPGEADRLRSGCEPTETVFASETVVLELRTDLALPLESVPIEVWRNDQRVTIQGRQTLTLTRVPGARHIYRSPALFLTADAAGGAPDGAVPLTIGAGDALFARVQDRQMFLIPPLNDRVGVGVASVMTRPSTLPWDARAKVFNGPTEVVETRTDEDTLWKDALRRAAGCHPGIQIDDLEALAAGSSDTVTNLMVVNWPPTTRSIGVTFGDHAAMILLRDEFVRMMKEALARIPEVRTPAEIEQFRRLMRPYVETPSFPLARVQVTAPVSDLEGAAREAVLMAALGPLLASQLDADRVLGTTVPYGFAFAEDFSTPYFRAHFGDDTAAAKAWADNAIVEGLQEYRLSIRDAIARAEAAGDCDVEELIAITGSGFESVVARVLPRLVKPRVVDGRTVWVPDTRARLQLTGVATLARAVRDQEAWADLDTTVLMTAAAGAAAVPAVFTNAAWAAVLAVGVDLVDVGVSVARGLTQWSASADEQRLANAAAELIGVDRARQAEIDAYGGWDFLLEVGGAGLGAGAGGLDAITKLRRARGAAALRGVRAADGTTNLDALTDTQWRDLQRFMAEAEGLKPRELTRAQRDALALAQTLRADEGIDLAAEAARRLADAPAAGASSLRAAAPPSPAGDAAEGRPRPARSAGVLDRIPHRGASEAAPYADRLREAARGRGVDAPEVRVLDEEVFSETFQTSRGRAVMAIEAAEDGSEKAVVYVRRGADRSVVDEELIHVEQLADDAMRPHLRTLSETELSRWDQLPTPERVDRYASKYELEIDAQRRLIDRIAQTADPADPDALRRLEEAWRDLEHLRGKYSELIDPVRGPPRGDLLDQPPRLFNKETAEGFEVPDDWRELTPQRFVAAYKDRYPNTSLSDRELLVRHAQGKRLNPETGRLSDPTRPTGPAPPDVEARYVNDRFDRLAVEGDGPGTLGTTPRQREQWQRLLREREEARRLRQRLEAADQPAERALAQARSGLNRASERVGMYGSDLYVRQQYPGATRLYPRDGIFAPGQPGDFDLIYEVTDGNTTRFVVVESKGGSSALGSRRVGDGSVRAQQGTREYYDEILNRMIGSGDPAMQAAAQRLLLANPQSAVDYLHIKARIKNEVIDGVPRSTGRNIEVNRFDLSTNPVGLSPGEAGRPPQTSTPRTARLRRGSWRHSPGRPPERFPTTPGTPPRPGRPDHAHARTPGRPAPGPSRA